MFLYFLLASCSSIFTLVSIVSWSHTETDSGDASARVELEDCLTGHVWK